MTHKIPSTNIRKILVAIGFALAASGTHAASISLAPVGSTTGPVPNLVTFNLLANFGSITTTGGAMDLSWDTSVLDLQGFKFDPGFSAPPRDMAFDVVDLQSNGPQSNALFSIGFGNLGGIKLPTTTIIGSISFNLSGNPGSSSAITLSNSVKWSGFYDDMGTPISVSYTGAMAGVSAIPVPAAAWLFGSGIMALLGIARRSKRHA